MSERYLQYEDTLVVFDSDSFKLYLSIGDELLEVSDDMLRNKIRFHAQEISPRRAIGLNVSQ